LYTAKTIPTNWRTDSRNVSLRQEQDKSPRTGNAHTTTMSLPDPIAIPWTMKPVESAETKLEILDDGRLQLSIVHDVLHGVTPEMLVFWFKNMRGTMQLEGKTYPRYRIWHPYDHVEHKYLHTPAGGDGVGSVFLIHEVMGRDPRHTVNVETDVVRLDEGGFGHRPRIARVSGLVAMDYTFERVPGGTLYRNSLTVGLHGARRWARPLNALVQRFKFDEAHGRAWLKHNVEEVGNFEHFLPGLYAHAHGTSRGRVYSISG
jgi:hypothetical protein